MGCGGRRCGSWVGVSWCEGGGKGALHCGKGEAGGDTDEVDRADELVGKGGDGVARGDLGVEDVEGEDEEEEGAEEVGEDVDCGCEW